MTSPTAEYFIRAASKYGHDVLNATIEFGKAIGAAFVPPAGASRREQIQYLGLATRELAKVIVGLVVPVRKLGALVWGRLRSALRRSGRELPQAA